MKVEVNSSARPRGDDTGLLPTQLMLQLSISVFCGHITGFDPLPEPDPLPDPIFTGFSLPDPLPDPMSTGLSFSDADPDPLPEPISTGVSASSSTSASHSD